MYLYTKKWNKILNDAKIHFFVMPKCNFKENFCNYLAYPQITPISTDYDVHKSIYKAF